MYKSFQEDEEDEEEGAESAVKTSMLKLHKLYEAEHTEFSSLLTLAETTHPELLIEHPQLNAMSQGGFCEIPCVLLHSEELKLEGLS